ncbi:tRNA lysidine(34) synthetase TilS [Sediminibacterium roseum]|nr:tRNA lysidine(34) synthetase TilS [Sediminibacterium roseum]
MLNQFQQHWKKQFPQLSFSNCRLLLAVSGGMDSVVLVNLVHESGFDYTIAHCNFQLRGEESQRDENFVRALAEEYGREVLVKKFDTAAYAATNKTAIQEAARNLRYQWFSEVIAGWDKPSFIVTAHHADDNIETLLMHFFRGTGIQGLMGIQPIVAERRIIRPLLSFKKKDLVEYAKQEALDFVEDSSNASDKYTRNFFRNQLLPQIREVFPQVDDNLVKNIERFNEVSVLYKQSIDLHLSKLVEQKNNEIHVPVLKLKKAKPLHTIAWELIKPFGFSAAQTEEVVKLLEADSGSYQSSPTHRIIRNRNWLIIAPLAIGAAQHILVGEEDKKVAFENGVLTFHCAKFNNQSDTNEAWLDPSVISYPLLLRKCKTGDYFYPLGMQKKKKLSRFFIDQKLSRTEKENTWVIESAGRIAWVIGQRIDDRFKISDPSKDAICIRFEKTGR